MKSRNFSKKLSLNKTTIVHLNVYDLKNVHGGDSNPCAFTPDCPPTTGCPLSDECPTTGRIVTTCCFSSPTKPC